MANGTSFLNPTIFGKPLFPSAQRTGELARSAINFAAPFANAITSAVGRFTNPIQSVASDVMAARGAMAGIPLLGSRRTISEPSVPNATVLPSGTIVTQGGFDVYPSQPTMAPALTPTIPPRSGSVAQTTPFGPTNFGMSSQTLGVASAAQLPLSGINAPFSGSIQGMAVDKTPIATRVPEMPTGLAGAQPFNLSSPTQQTAPLLANQVPTTPVNVAQAKTPIKTPYGTIYATASQLGAAQEIAKRGPQAARMDALGQQISQAAKITLMRERGAKTMRENLAKQEEIIAARRANPTTYSSPSGYAISVPTNVYGQPIKSFMNQFEKQGRLNFGPTPMSIPTQPTQPRFRRNSGLV